MERLWRGFSLGRWGRASWPLALTGLAAMAPLVSFGTVSPMPPPRPTAVARGAVQVPRSPPGPAVPILVNGTRAAVRGRVDRGVTMARLGPLIRALGGTVQGTAHSGRARVLLAGKVVQAAAAQPDLMVDGRPVALTLAPRMVGGELYVPVRAVAQAAGYGLRWLAANGAVAIDTRGAAPLKRLLPPPAAAEARQAPARKVQAPTAPARPAGPAAVVPYTPADVALIGRVVHGEADSQPFAAKLGVAAVIVNRVRTPGFPKSIPAVVYAPGQFQSVGGPLYEQAPSPQDMLAATQALHGADPTGGALFFFNPATTWGGSWIFRLPVVRVLGAFRFAR